MHAVQMQMHMHMHALREPQVLRVARCVLHVVWGTPDAALVPLLCLLRGCVVAWLRGGVVSLLRCGVVR